MNSANVARRRLITIGLGWVSVAVLEAIAYTTLALSIADHRSPVLVLATATIALFVTVLVSRGGYFTGARLVGDLYDALGDAFARAKLSWFTDDNRALLATVAGRGIPSLMSVPAHQLQTFLVAPLDPAAPASWGSRSSRGQVSCCSSVDCSPCRSPLRTLAQRALSRADERRHEVPSSQQLSRHSNSPDHLELLRTAAGPTRSIERIERSWRNQEAALARTNLAAAPATFISAIATIVPLAGAVIFLAATGFDDPAAALALVILTARAAAPLDELALAGIGVNELRATVRDYRTATSAPALAEPAPRDAARPVGTDIEVAGVDHARFCAASPRRSPRVSEFSSQDARVREKHTSRAAHALRRS